MSAEVPGINASPTYQQLLDFMKRPWRGDFPYANFDFSQFPPNEFSLNEIACNGVSGFFSVLDSMKTSAPALLYLSVEYFGEDFNAVDNVWRRSVLKLSHLASIHSVDEFSADDRQFYADMDTALTTFGQRYCVDNKCSTTHQYKNGQPQLVGFREGVSEVIFQAKKSGKLSAMGGIF